LITVIPSSFVGPIEYKQQTSIHPWKVKTMTHSGGFSICFFQRGQTSKEKGPPIKESVRKDLKKFNC
jgi:hypothetical protein